METRKRKRSGSVVQVKKTSKTIQSSESPKIVSSQEKRNKNVFIIKPKPFDKFNKKRVKVLSKKIDVPEWSKAIVYWMLRDMRVQDNWAFLYAQKIAKKLKCPLHVCHCLSLLSPGNTSRRASFLLGGLKEVQQECQQLSISFHLLTGAAPTVLPPLLKSLRAGGLVTDFSPLRPHTQDLASVLAALPSDVAVCQVDAHNVVPCWEASTKQEYAAKTLRPRLLSHLPEFLTHFPTVEPHPFPPLVKAEPLDWERVESELELDSSVPPSPWATPGTTAGLAALQDFCSTRLRLFASSNHNDPNMDTSSNLSPWLNFGHISAQRCVLTALQQAAKHRQAVEAYMEQVVIRKELTDNFCFYNPNYDQIDGAPSWALKTLQDHAGDTRSPLYSRAQLEAGKTQDHLWNAAQKVLVRDGLMHNFLRMYWAKKILEWTSSPEEALDIAIFLNDHYQLDGCDPNGFVGCMWSICGIHDTAWKERPIFGKVRYMNYQGCRRKFDVDAFVKSCKV